MFVTLAALLLRSLATQREPEIVRPEYLTIEDALPPIDEAAVLAFVKKPFDPKSGGRWHDWSRTLGMLRGVPVVVSYRCSDFAPSTPGESCGTM